MRKSRSSETFFAVSMRFTFSFYFSAFWIRSSVELIRSALNFQLFLRLIHAITLGFKRTLVYKYVACGDWRHLDCLMDATCSRGTRQFLPPTTERVLLRFGAAFDPMRAADLLLATAIAGDDC